MTTPAHKTFEFGPFLLDTTERVLLRDGQPVPLTLKAFDVLLLLVENRGHIVEKDQLMNRVWAGSFVEEGNLKVTVSRLRKALEDDHGGARYIETVPRRGYRFLAGVNSAEAENLDLVLTERTRASVTIDREGIVTGRDKSRRLNFLLAGALLIVLGMGAISILAFLVLRPALRGGQPGTKSPINSIAVLPFKPLAADARDESLELGIAETLITRLNRQRQVMVRPMSAVRRYAAAEVDPVAAGREQRVEAVLDGSIQKSGDRIRVTVRLVNVADGRQIWAEKFDERSTDIFRIQDSISRQVAEAMVQLTGGEKELLARRDTDDPGAYSLYIKGRYFWNKRTAESLNKSIEFFNQAIAKDPNYALAYSGLADAYVVLPTHSNASMSETHPKARAYAQRALEINNQLPEAYTTLASIAADYWQWAEANKRFQQALDLNPNYATAHQWYGEFLVHTGRLDEALVEFRRALELDPTSLIINFLVGETLYLQRRYDDSIEQCSITLEMDRDFMVAHWFLAMNYEQKAMHAEAIAEFEKAMTLSADATNVMASLGAAYAKSGNRKAALTVRRKLNDLLKQGRARPSDMAVIQIGLGEKEQALKWLEQGYQNHEHMLLYIGIDPFFDPLRSDPRFADLVRRVRTS